MYLWSALISLSALALALINGRVLVGAIVGATVVVLAATALPRMLGSGRRATAAIPDVPPVERPDSSVS
jgi:hypothetical protein